MSRHAWHEQDDSGEAWVFRAPQIPSGAHLGRRGERTASWPAPGLPTDRYAEDRTTGSTPRIRPDDTWVELPPLAVGRVPMPVDQPYPPHPVSPERPTPAEPPSLAVQAQDAIREWALIVTVILAAVSLVIAGLVTSVRDHQRMGVLNRQNQDLRTEQNRELQRLAAAEKAAADAQTAADQAERDLEDLRQRVDQLDAAGDQTSGS